MFTWNKKKTQISYGYHLIKQLLKKWFCFSCLLQAAFLSSSSRILGKKENVIDTDFD